MGTISRRDIADGLRALDALGEPPLRAALDDFDAYMKGPSTMPSFDTSANVD
jgi:hypothetical protein